MEQAAFNSACFFRKKATRFIIYTVCELIVPSYTNNTSISVKRVQVIDARMSHFTFYDIMYEQVFLRMECPNERGMCH